MNKKRRNMGPTMDWRTQHVVQAKGMNKFITLNGASLTHRQCFCVYVNVKCCVKLPFTAGRTGIKHMKLGKTLRRTLIFICWFCPRTPAKAHVKNRTALKLSTFLDLEKEKVYHTTHVEITGQFAEIGSFLGLRDQTQVARLHGSCCGATNS